jgi:hypothetical protein
VFGENLTSPTTLLTNLLRLRSSSDLPRWFIGVCLSAMSSRGQHEVYKRYYARNSSKCNLLRIRHMKVCIHRYRFECYVVVLEQATKL